METYKFKFTCSVDENHTKGKLFDNYCGVCPICGISGVSKKVLEEEKTLPKPHPRFGGTFHAHIGD